MIWRKKRLSRQATEAEAWKDSRCARRACLECVRERREGPRAGPFVRVLRWVQSQRGSNEIAHGRGRGRARCALKLWGVKSRRASLARRSREAEHDTRRHLVGALHSKQTLLFPDSTLRPLIYPFHRRANAPGAIVAFCTDKSLNMAQTRWPSTQRNDESKWCTQCKPTSDFHLRTQQGHPALALIK
jgi:hypothetical protein